MVEKQTINGKDVWLRVEPYHVPRANRNIIPTEYFTASYYFQEPTSASISGEEIKEEDGTPKLFESPVAALGYVSKSLLTEFKRSLKKASKTL